ncbi:type VI secretion system Vgr family protein [Lysobacter koreensis]|uniref:Type VI secretion system Vgr family protein n=1 Tax=Lysobacter koreensis TaxID=266122 RepID=A0ABW2YPU2_9GAMM
MDIQSLARHAGDWLGRLSPKETSFGASQHARLIEIDTALPGAFVVERFAGREAVCAPFEFTIDCLSASAFLDVRALIGQPIALRLRQATGAQRQWHGHCTQLAPLGSDGGLARYRLTMAPWTAFLALRRNALIFQDLDALGVLERVFADYPQAAFRFDAGQALTTPAITTQYRESDWDFVVRLLADAGLAWRFEHAQTDEPRSPGGTSFGAHTLVVFDRAAQLPAATPDTLRFHRSDATESLDAITQFGEQRQATVDAFTTASWMPEQVEALSATSEADPASPHLPLREAYRVPRAGRFAQREHAQLTAELRLDALRLPQRLHAGSGNGRGLDAGVVFTLSQHPDLSGQAFVPLAVEHLAANNLGSGIVELLDDAGLEHGSYRNRFLAVPQGTPIVPMPGRKPHIAGAQTARVVGLPDAANTSNRDHQVRIQFAWQRGAQPHAGGLSESGSSAHPDGHAPGNETSGTWVRVAEWLAGPNWGSHALPRIGSEVLVEFLHADIDQPLVTGQLYNGEVAPPFALGDASNHLGTLSGLHTQSLDGGGQQQWLLDDAPGQLRQRLHTTLADSRLELGYLVEHGNGHRGNLRGQGFDLATLGWGNLRAGAGVLVSSTARANASSTQFDVAEAVSQLQAAAQTAQALSDAAGQHHVAPLSANAQQTQFITMLDVEQDGKYAGAVNGQATTKPSGGKRDGAQGGASAAGAGGAGAASGDPVERFARPLLLVEGPDRIALATPKSALAYAGGNVHLTAQQDLHLVAGETYAAVSGAHVALFAQQGPIRTIAANGPVSLQAHVGPLELLADQSVTITATDERIDVLASKKIVLQAGQTQVTLEGGNITFACPGNFTVKASENPFLSGARDAAILAKLPDTRIKRFDQQFQLINELTGEPVEGMPYKLLLASGDEYFGSTDHEGKTLRVGSVASEEAKVVWGETQAGASNA